MEPKNYVFTRRVIFQGKFSAAMGDTLMQVGPEQFVYSGQRGTVEVVLRTKTIETYLKEGWIAEQAGLDAPGEEPKDAPPAPAPAQAEVKKAPEPVTDTTARIIPTAPIPMEHAPSPETVMAMSKKPTPPDIVPKPKPTPPLQTPKKAEAPKKVEAPKPAPKKAAETLKPKPETKAIVAMKHKDGELRVSAVTPKGDRIPVKEVTPVVPEKTSSILDAALSDKDGDPGVDAVLSRVKKVVRKGR